MTGDRLKHAWLLLLMLNSLYWVFFWTSFFLHSVPEPPVVPWDEPVPFYIVLGRALPTPAPSVFHTPLLRSAFWLNVPSWVLTWPLGYIMGTKKVIETNSAGLRLILVTVLSYGQWYAVSFLFKIGRRTRLREP